MMLREAVAKILFACSIGELTTPKIEICNKFIDDYNKVKNLLEGD